MNTDLTSGNVTRSIIRLAWPTTVAMSLQTAFNLVDTFFVSRLGAQAIAAVSMMFPVFFLMFGLAGGMGIGTASLVARCLGTGNTPRGESAAQHAVLLSVALGIAFTVAGLLCQARLFAAMGAGPQILPLVLSYSTWIFGGSIFIFIGIAASSILRGQGDMKTPMTTMIVSVVLNTALDPLLIFGVGPFPELGVEGAALATFAARGVGCVLIVGYLMVGRPSVKLRIRGFSADTGVVGSILAVGVPTSLNRVVMSASRMLLIRIVASFGYSAIAAFGLVMRMDQLVILPSLGISTAVIALVGHNVGARHFDRAESCVWRSAVLAMIVMEALGIVFFLTPSIWIGIFTKAPDVMAHGTSYLRIVPLTYMFMGLSIIMGAAFQGAGKGMPALVISSLRLLVLTVPGALVLSRLMGLRGVWLAIAGSVIIASLVSAFWFGLGTWRRGGRPSGREPAESRVEQ